MTSRLAEALQGLEAALAESGAPTMRYLRPGISVDQQEEILRLTGLQLSAELATLWSWRDGTFPTADPVEYRKSMLVHIFRLCAWAGGDTASPSTPTRWSSQGRSLRAKLTPNARERQILALRSRPRTCREPPRPLLPVWPGCLFDSSSRR